MSEEKKQRADQSDRRAFRKDAYEEMGRNDSQLHALTDGNGKPHSWRGGFRGEDGSVVNTTPPGFYTDVGEKPGFVETSMDAGHTKSSASGENRYALETSSSNRRDGAKLERSGHILEKEAVEIDGVSVNRKTAQTLEDRGVLKSGTVASAKPTTGWSKEEQAADKSKAPEGARPQNEARQQPQKDDAKGKPVDRQRQYEEAKQRQQERQATDQEKQKQQAAANKQPRENQGASKDDSMQQRQAQQQKQQEDRKRQYEEAQKRQQEQQRRQAEDRKQAEQRKQQDKQQQERREKYEEAQRRKKAQEEKEKEKEARARKKK